MGCKYADIDWNGLNTYMYIAHINIYIQLYKYICIFHIYSYAFINNYLAYTK